MRIEFPWLAMALKNALRNRRRSLVTLAIAATGTAAALLGGGFALYTYQSLAEASARDTGHVVVAAPHYFDGAENTPLEFGLEQRYAGPAPAGTPGSQAGAAAAAILRPDRQWRA
jgi:putative ABC transport system permease protein